MRCIIATTLLCWKKIPYNDVTLISIRNQSTLQCKSNKIHNVATISRAHWVDLDYIRQIMTFGKPFYYKT